VTLPSISGSCTKCAAISKPRRSHFIQCANAQCRERAPWTTVWTSSNHSGMMALARGQLTDAKYQLQAG